MLPLLLLHTVDSVPFDALHTGFEVPATREAKYGSLLYIGNVSPRADSRVSRRRKVTRRRRLVDLLIEETRAPRTTAAVANARIPRVYLRVLREVGRAMYEPAIITSRSEQRQWNTRQTVGLSTAAHPFKSSRRKYYFQARRSANLTSFLRSPLSRTSLANFDVVN